MYNNHQDIRQHIDHLIEVAIDDMLNNSWNLRMSHKNSDKIHNDYLMEKFYKQKFERFFFNWLILFTLVDTLEHKLNRLIYILWIDHILGIDFDSYIIYIQLNKVNKYSFEIQWYFFHSYMNRMDIRWHNVHHREEFHWEDDRQYNLLVSGLYIVHMFHDKYEFHLY